jgi:hypothetical protein
VKFRAEFQGRNVKAFLRLLLRSLNYRRSNAGSVVSALRIAFFWAASILAVYPLVAVRAMLMRDRLPTSLIDVCRSTDRSATRYVLLKWTT